MFVAASMVPINLLKQKPKEQLKKYFGELRWSGWDAENHGHNRHYFEMDDLPEEIHILPIATMEDTHLPWLGDKRNPPYRTYWGVVIKEGNSGWSHTESRPYWNVPIYKAVQDVMKRRQRWPCFAFGGLEIYEWKNGRPGKRLFSYDVDHVEANYPAGSEGVQVWKKPKGVEV